MEVGELLELGPACLGGCYDRVFIHWAPSTVPIESGRTADSGAALYTVVSAQIQVGTS